MTRFTWFTKVYKHRVVRSKEVLSLPQAAPAWVTLFTQTAQSCESCGTFPGTVRALAVRDTLPSTRVLAVLCLTLTKQA